MCQSQKEGMVDIWNIDTGTLLHSLKGHAGDIYDAAFSPDESKLITASEDKSVKIWDLASGQN